MNFHNNKLFFCRIILCLCLTIVFCLEITFAETINTSKHVIVVSPKIFNDTIQEWIKYRSNQGYRITLINADETISPQQIRDRIFNAANNSNVNSNIAAILIVGNAVVRTESDRGRVILSPRLPCRVINEFANDPHLASDDWYADFNEDNYPDCPVGRFPVNSIESLNTIIKKTIRYETEIKPDLKRRQIQVVAGVGNFSPLIDLVIESAGRYVFMKKLPLSYEISFLHANWKSAFCPSPIDIRNEYLNTLNRAPLFWIYIGHGQHRNLQPLSTPRENIKTLGEDSDNQNNFPILNCQNSLPIVMLLCCYGGTLDARTKSTAEELLLQENGAVSVIATSRAAMPYGLAVFGTECLDEFIKSQNKPEKILLGSIIFETKKRMQTIIKESKINDAKNNLSESQKSDRLNSADQKAFRENITGIAKWLDPFPTKLDLQLEEHIEQIHLFGDPLLVIPQSIPISLDVQQRIKSGEKLKINGKIQLETFKQIEQLDQANHRPDNRNDLNFRNDNYDAVGKTIMIDLSISPDRISIRSLRRENMSSCDISTREADNNEYKLSNQHVISRFIIPINSEGIFETEIPIPQNLRGKYLIRAFANFPKVYAIGSTTIIISR
jgi:hypothetical protein